MEHAQSTDAVLMIEPVNFYSNPATLSDNHYQQTTGLFSREEIQKEALSEFCAFRRLLQERGVKVQSFTDVAGNDTPDSIFPNNWFSTDHRGTLFVYAMKTQSRRREKRADIIEFLRQCYPQIIDYGPFEQQGVFLEGTGSLVLDRINQVAYANLSQRTHEELLGRWAQDSGFRVVKFRAYDSLGQPIYHTNVMMSIGTNFAVVSLAAIKDQGERQAVWQSLAATGRKIVEISQAQVGQYCGNMLELAPRNSKYVLALSSHAYRHLEPAQLDCLQQCAEIIHSDLSTIEMIGGGSARCMLAELF